MSDITIKFLYKTSVGRTILKGLVNPKISLIGGRILSSKVSVGLIKPFIKKNRIDIRKYIVPKDGYKSFNDFFIREKVEKLRISNASFICPCDGLLTSIRIKKDSTFEIKNTTYSLKALLDNEDLAKEFEGGEAFIFRLTPSHYHHYVYCTNGEVLYRKRIKGVLHSVRPICIEENNVFIQNSREYDLICDDFNDLVVQMEVGALMVGKINNRTLDNNNYIRKGEEKGYFEFGGSTIIVLRTKNSKYRSSKISFLSDGKEIEVKIGESL